MDAVRLAVLRAEVEAQWERIEQVFLLIEERANGMREDDPASVESVSYQLHNLYSAVEDLMKMVAAAFENSVADASQWHAQLLNRMMLTIEGVRPALFGKDTAVLLHELRSFRHFFRHAYAVPLVFARVAQNVEKARESRALLNRDVRTFLQQLDDEWKQN